MLAAQVWGPGFELPYLPKEPGEALHTPRIPVLWAAEIGEPLVTSLTPRSVKDPVLKK